MSALAVVIVTYNASAELPELARTLGAECLPGDEIVIVDNASSDGSAERARELGERFAVIEKASNVGFAAGARAGANATSAPLLLFLNPDVRLEPGSIARLRAIAEELPAWSAWQPAVMLTGGRINSAGGVAHYLAISWAGQCERPASELPDAPYEVAFASGAALMIRRVAWEELDGFDDSYFLYGEDLELGLRLWLTGHRVGVEPRARVIHDYEFDRGSQKWFLLERNRWRTLIGLYPTGLLVALAPALTAAELALLVVAARDGWLAAKLRADLATLIGIPRALRRRAAIKSRWRIGALAFTGQLTASLDSPYIGPLPKALIAAQAGYFAAVRLILRCLPSSPASIARSARGARSGGPEAP